MGRERLLRIFAVLALSLLNSSLWAQPSQPSRRVVHVFVALCDNASQGIQPVPAFLGNGNDPAGNLYWGADHGVKTEFRRSGSWRLIKTWKSHDAEIVMERCAFKHRDRDVWLVADAYRGNRIRDAIEDFFSACSGQTSTTLTLADNNTTITLGAAGAADLLVYVGHDGLMEFSVPELPAVDSKSRQAIVLACISREYFAPLLKATGAQPLLWTTDLMAPEAYTLKDALDGWILNESAEQIRDRAAQAYARNQDCSVAAAKRLLVTGWPKE